MVNSKELRQVDWDIVKLVNSKKLRQVDWGIVRLVNSKDLRQVDLALSSITLCRKEYCCISGRLLR